jgi:hypothetical protein
MFQLTKDEATALRLQSATSSDGHGGRRYALLDEVFQALRQLISPPPRPKRPVGFRLPEGDK